MSELKPLPCPFCGGAPRTAAHPDNIDGTRFFYALVCYCGGYSACAHKMAVEPTPEQAKRAAIEAWNRRAQPAQAGQVLSDEDVLRAAARTLDSEVVEVSPLSCIKDFARAIEAAVLAKRVPMQQISDGEFAPDAKLLELADKIDHEQNWRHSGIFQRDHLTQDQKDRVLAGVMLRRYADLMAPESWRLFPPKSVVSHSYRAATLEAVVKMAERHGIVGEKGGA